MDPAETLHIELPDGSLAVVAIQIQEEPLPTPHEQPHKRIPTARELEEIARQFAARRYTFAPADR